MRDDDPMLSPPSLGRGVIVDAGAPAPDAWSNSPRVVVDDAVLRDPRAAVEQLHELWATRQPAVVDLRVPVEALREPEHDERPPCELTPRFEFTRERLYFLVRANNYDARGGEPRWWPAREAIRLGARVGDATDIVLADGTSAWCDGGPRTRGIVDGAVVHRWSLEAGRLRADADAAESRAAQSLAPDQQAAVLHPGGPARILAPAGSGKTTVLTARFRHLVVERDYGPDSVCALAYNKRAGDEMRGRLADLPRTALRKVRTLNSFGYDILGRARPGLHVIDEVEIRKRIEPHLNIRRRANTDPYAPYLEALEEVQLALRSPDQVETDRGDVDGFAQMYRNYRDGLQRDGVIDFDGQIFGAAELLLQDPPLRTALQRECRHLLVDEFQDLRPAHLLLLRLVAAPAFDMFGVGDDDQVIYGYSGADPDFLIRFSRYFPAAADHPLEVNYRCPPAVVDAARTLLAHNRRRVDKTIRAGRAAELDAPEPLPVERAAAERLAARAVELITEWLTDGAEPDSIAVLARVNAALLPVQVLAHDAGLPVTIAVGEQFLRRTGVRAALAYLRLAVAARDGGQLRGSDLVEVARRPTRRISPQVLERVRNRRFTVASLRAFGARASADGLTDLADDVEGLAKRAQDSKTAALLRAVRDEIGLGSAMNSLDRTGKGRDASHLDDLTALVAIADVHPDPATFEAWLRDHLRGAAVHDDPSEHGRVTLSTVHRVKGMEWDRVIVLGAHDGLMPHRLANDTEEERRIFHVAITRCRDQAVVLVDADAGATFVDEMFGRVVQRTLHATSKQDSGLFEALRDWRRERARQDGVPAYVVFHDATLRDIAAASPRTLRELGRISGIGPTKLERYGDDVLRVIKST
jgi:ATP-dependent DNA helicase UvrD/PcrA